MAVLLSSTVMGVYSNCEIYGTCEPVSTFDGRFTSLDFTGTTGFDDFQDNVGGGGAGGGNSTEEMQDAVGGGLGEGLTYNDAGNYLNHSDTSNQSSSDNTGLRVIQDIFLDALGHLTSLATVDLTTLITTHVHDQNLNTTANVTFFNTTVEGNLNVSNWVSLQGTHNMNFISSGDNAILNFLDVGGVNYLELATTGAFFQLYGNPGPANNYLLATITETQGSDTELNFYEGGTGHNRFWDSGSARFGGGASYLCSNVTDFVDCDTTGTGADVVVQDDIFAGGQFIGNTTGSWSNVTINKSQVIDYNKDFIIPVVCGKVSVNNDQYIQCDSGLGSAVRGWMPMCNGSIRNFGFTSRLESVSAGGGGELNWSFDWEFRNNGTAYPELTLNYRNITGLGIGDSFYNYTEDFPEGELTFKKGDFLNVYVDEKNGGGSAGLGKMTAKAEIQYYGC